MCQLLRPCVWATWDTHVPHTREWVSEYVFDVILCIQRKRFTRAQTFSNIYLELFSSWRKLHVCTKILLFRMYLIWCVFNKRHKQSICIWDYVFTHKSLINYMRDFIYTFFFLSNVVVFFFVVFSSETVKKTKTKCHLMT